jgi:4-hydroxy-3-polyprenylbenzoate decarboxylase
MMMPRHDLRAFLDRLAEIGDLQEIDQEVDWNLELGAVIRRSLDLRAPAPLFNAIKGIEPGYRVLGAPGGLTAIDDMRFARIAFALGLPPGARGRDLVEALATARARPGIKPRIVGSGPCKENVLLGEQIDLLKFPTPLIHGGDGGRFIQTYGVNIVRSVDGKWTNWSINRMMLLDRNRLACLIPPNQHLGIIHAQWAEKGESTPIAVALGVEPAIAYAGGMPIPEGADEADLVGALRGQPVELIPCETVPLEVPASAEIVIEGHISHTETELEGPMGEYAGYISPEPGTPKPVLHVTAITHRNQPILPVSAAGKPVEENHTGWGLPHAAEMLYVLRERRGLPVMSCWMVLESACCWFAVTVSQDWPTRTGQSARELATTIGGEIFATKGGFGIPKVLLFEDDVDITNVNEVVWAFATRAHPGHGEVYFESQAENNLPVFLDNAEKRIFLLNEHYPPESRPVAVSFEADWPLEIQRRVLERWTSFGYRGIVE